jgi:RNA polymerase sigma-70 factor (ECF subfamily)
MAEPPAQITRVEYLELRGALAKLRAEEREAVILIAASGFSYADAANICGCAEGTVKSRVHRARARLAELLSIEPSDGFAAYPTNGAALLDAGRAMIDA